MSSQLDEEKKFYERFYCLLNDRQLMQVFERYGPAAFRRSSVLEGLEKYIVSRGFGGHTCVEIGTLRGLTAIVLARYFQRVITIDIVDQPEKYEIAKMLGVRNIEFVNIRNNAEKAEIVNGIYFDGAYMDGDHHADTVDDFGLLKRGGRVLCHEAWDAQPIVMRTICAAGGTVHNDQKWALWTAHAEQKAA